VHGTTITLQNAGRLCGFGSAGLKGKLFVTSGLGGMSGAQALASVIVGATSIIAEVDGHAIRQRLDDGYIQQEHLFTNLNELIRAAEEHRSKDNAVTLIYHGNIVEVWETLARQNVHVDLGSDQTSLHNIDDMGYCPAGYTYEEAQKLLISDKEAFKKAVAE
jgi:urocanate hydratase